MADRNDDTVNIPIRIRNDHNLNGDKKGLKAGSFEGPDPLVSVTPGTRIQWEIHPDRYDFTITFHNVSPFSTGELVVGKEKDGKSRALAATGSGHYHYSVSVTDDAGNTYVISSCPELDVGGIG